MKKTLLFTNVFTIALLAFTIFKAFTYRAALKTTSVICSYGLSDFDFHYRKEVDSPNILMIGNSLIRRAKWDSLLHRKDVINRGISGDGLACICNRLKYLQNTGAKICFIEGGINDLMISDDTETLFNYYKQIVSFWRAEGKIPVINLIIYINSKASTRYTSVNKSIYNLNNRLRNFAIKEKIDYIDLNKKISNENEKILKDEYTKDGVHLTDVAYSIWSEEIQYILKKNRI
jgi:lysophospholipase L1-like esterase